MGIGPFLSHGTVKSTVSQRMDGLNYFWEVEVKNGHVTLISEEQDNLADFLHAHTYLG